MFRAFGNMVIWLWKSYGGVFKRACTNPELRTANQTSNFTGSYKQCVVRGTCSTRSKTCRKLFNFKSFIGVNSRELEDKLELT